MKKLFYIPVAVFILLLTSCNSGKPEAEKTMQTIQEATSSSNYPPTDKNGYYMKAVIDGKEWIANGMMHDEDSNSNFKQVVGDGDEISIAFQLWKQGTTVGAKRPFRDDYVANLTMPEDMLGGRTGELEITRADEEWIEGKFYFTATSSSSGKKVDVKDGFFRVSAK